MISKNLTLRLAGSLASSAWLLALAAIPACDHASTTPSSSLPTVQVPIGQKTYTLEIVAKTEERNTGLMRRDSMPEDHGMIFIFKAAEPRSFWMKNTRIPLDILYLDPTGKVVSIHRMEPYVEIPTRSKAPAKYAIELNAGQAEAATIHEGDTVTLPDNIKSIDADP